MSKKLPYVQILDVPSQLSLAELAKMRTDIGRISRNPPEVDPESDSHDAWKFTNRPLNDEIFLRVYVDRTEEGFEYRAEMRGSRTASSRSTSCLARKDYKTTFSEV